MSTLQELPHSNINCIKKRKPVTKLLIKGRDSFENSATKYDLLIIHNYVKKKTISRSERSIREDQVFRSSSPQVSYGASRAKSRVGRERNSAYRGSLSAAQRQGNSCCLYTKYINMYTVKALISPLFYKNFIQIFLIFSFNENLIFILLRTLTW